MAKTLSSLNGYEIVDKTARDKIDNLSIGTGTNIISPNGFTASNPYTLETTAKDGFIEVKSLHTTIPLVGNQSYIISAKTDGVWADMHTNIGQDQKYVTLWLCLNYLYEDSYRHYYVLLNDINNMWVWKCPKECDGMYATIRLNNYNTDGTTKVVHKFWDFKMFVGNELTDAICNKQSAIMYGNVVPDNVTGSDRDFYVMI